MGVAPERPLREGAVRIRRIGFRCVVLGQRLFVGAELGARRGSRQRDRVLEYVRRTYGADRVALVSTVSTLQPRIMVKGDGNVLRNADSKRMIRALLLAGMRAAVLWRQCGGNRIRLIFQREQLIDSCR